MTEQFTRHASPDAIRAEIKKARANRDRWQRRVDEMARLLDTRLGQIDAGTWPATDEQP
ncbi:hypothetical protein [Streptomyces vinaceus]|uniref:hypothetical protein n=1 Tax=Streptomyces vinaceus TaxID=1960 RepID=UPI0036B31BB0